MASQPNNSAQRRVTRAGGQLGGLKPPASLTTETDSSGSSTILVSMTLHLVHTNIRFSEWPSRGSAKISVIRLLHLLQRGRSSQLIGGSF
jgi:hypothetical protein